MGWSAAPPDPISVNRPDVSDDRAVSTPCVILRCSAASFKACRRAAASLLMLLAAEGDSKLLTGLLPGLLPAAWGAFCVLC